MGKYQNPLSAKSSLKVKFIYYNIISESSIQFYTQNKKDKSDKYEERKQLYEKWDWSINFFVDLGISFLYT